MRLEQYESLAGKYTLSRIKLKAEKLKGKHIINVNSTYYGGGVAEILGSLVLLMNDLGITTGWRIIKGNPDFFTITKKFHNALQGEKINLSRLKKTHYEYINEMNSIFSHIGGHDCIIVHDPQPLPLITHYTKTHPWIWRCHIDLTRPNKELLTYLKTFIKDYDLGIVSNENFQKYLGIPSKVVYPSIDPLSMKNIELSKRKVKSYLKKFNIPMDKPIISQISRFDKWKDPSGVIEAYKIVKKKVDCRLVLLGSMASDDPEGQRIYEEVLSESRLDDDIIVINFDNNILVNALQRASTVIIQKSKREGFGLTVTEAMWKGKAVVAGNVGGIKMQIEDGKNGFLVEDINSCAKRTIELLESPKLAKKMGEEAHKTVLEKFLITRHLEDYLDILNKIIGG